MIGVQMMGLPCSCRTLTMTLLAAFLSSDEMPSLNLLVLASFLYSEE
jgi:hypothetical protein